ncbi:MAG TPA: hypothetical protein VGC67_07980 [Cellulomonas sp.]
MILDLSRALRDAVDLPGRDPAGSLAPDALRTRIRRRRAVRTGTRSVAGVGAACAVGAGTFALLGTDGPPATPSGAGTATASPTPSDQPSGTDDASSSADLSLCGQTVDDLAEDPTGVIVSVGLPTLVDLGSYTGRTLGPSTPVWVGVPADAGAATSTIALGGTSLVLAQDGVVVAVADGGATPVAVEPATDAVAAAATPQDGTDGSGDLIACPDGTDGTDGTADEVAPGAYALHAVTSFTAADGGATRRAISAGIPLTLLPTASLLTAGADGVPADFPTDQVPVVGGEVTSTRELVGGGVEVTVAVTGTDAILRAAIALGLPSAGVNAVWGLANGASAAKAELAAAAAAEAEVAGSTATSTADLARSASRALGSSGLGEEPGSTVVGVTGVQSALDRLEVDGSELRVTVRLQAGATGDELVYQVTPTP